MRYIRLNITQAYLKQLGLQHVRTAVAYPQSNGKIERYHRTLEEECVITILIDDFQSAGKHTITFRGNNLPSGLYIYTLSVREINISKSMLLLK